MLSKRRWMLAKLLVGTLPLAKYAVLGQNDNTTKVSRPLIAACEASQKELQTACEPLKVKKARKA